MLVETPLEIFHKLRASRGSPSPSYDIMTPQQEADWKQDIKKMAEILPRLIYLETLKCWVDPNSL